MDAVFGLGRLHHIFTPSAREHLVRTAIEAGFRTFDLAPAYGDGLAERELGRILQRQSQAVSITTKFGIPFRPIGELPGPLYLAIRGGAKVLRTSFGAQYDRRDFSPSVLIKSVDASLRRLKRDALDCLLIHEPISQADYQQLGPTWDELRRQRSLGKIRSFGISGECSHIVQAVADGLIPPDAIRMIPMCPQAASLPGEWFQGVEVRFFNIVKHLRSLLGPGRIDARTLVDRATTLAGRARLVLASNRPDEVSRLGIALSERQAAGGAK